VELREEAPDVDRRVGVDAVVEAPGRPESLPLVLVEPVVDGVEAGDGAAVGQLVHPDTGLDVVDPAAVPVVGAPEHETQLLVRPEPIAVGAAVLVDVAATLEVGVASLPADSPRLLVSRDLGHEVDRAADRIAVLISRQGLVELDGADEIGRDGVELELPTVAFRRWDVGAIDRTVRVARLESPHLHVLPLALVPLKGNARKPTDGVGHIGVRQARDHLRREYVDDVLGALLLIEGRDLAAGPRRRDRDLLGDVR
jgi:hypothetical protein